MKCQNCGRNEVTFHYTSNINGCVTESHLCSECAAKSGYDFSTVFNMGSVFDSFFPMTQRVGTLLPATAVSFPNLFGLIPQMGILVQNNPYACGHTAPTAPEQMSDVDDKMKKRRELNVIREQMRKAAENEEYEKAAELRDKLKEMEEHL